MVHILSRLDPGIPRGGLRGTYPGPHGLKGQFKDQNGYYLSDVAKHCQCTATLASDNNNGY